MGFGSNIFTASRFSIDGVTIVENIVTGKIQTVAGNNTIFSSTGPIIVMTTSGMGGIGVQLTPQYTGNLRISVALSIGQLDGPAVAGTQIYYGTGPPPQHTDAQTGSPIGILYLTNQDGNINPYSTSEIILLTGLTLGTTYWFDFYLTINASGAQCVITYPQLLIEETN